MLISVIIPCYNAAAYLAGAIDSVLKQTHQQFELILVNDGSTDESEIIIQSFTDKRIRYFYQTNKGQCAASNFGLAKATGDYIKFFDADDVMNKTHLEAQLKKLNGRTDALASCAWGRFYDGNPSSAKFIPEPVWKDMKPLDWIKTSLSQKYDMMGGWLWLIPKPLIEKAGGWDEQLSLNNDFEFSMRLLMYAEEVLFAEDAKLYYRSGIESLSNHFSIYAHRSALLSTDLGCRYLLAKENSAFTQRLCADRYQEWLFRIYPSDKALVNELEQKIKSLGGSKRKIDGGRLFQFFSSFIGWKNTKHIKQRLIKLGYTKLPFN